MGRMIALACLVLASVNSWQAKADPFQDATWAYEAGDYETAAKLWRPLAQMGDDRAQMILGIMYQEGTGVAQNPVRAHMWHNLAAANGNEKARAWRDKLFSQLTLAQTAEAQELAKQWSKNHPGGVRLAILPPVGQRGSAQSRFELGVMYDEGRGAIQDFAEALNWYGLAAEQGHAGAQRNLGRMYLDGKGLARSHQEAARWLALASDQGDGEAQVILGGMYRQGQGVAVDPVKAHMWFNLSAANDNKAARALRDSIAKDMTAAQIAQAQKLAREWLAGHSRAQQRVDVAGILWRLKRAKRGDVNQMFLVGMMYDIGHDVRQNRREALRWYLMAAAKGHVGAQYNLGAAYYLGYGVAQDYVEAHKWFSIANITGLERAIVNRNILAEIMTEAQIAEARQRKEDWLARYGDGG